MHRGTCADTSGNDGTTPTRFVARLAEAEGKVVLLETSLRLSRDMAFGAVPYAANCLEQRELATMGSVGAIKFFDNLSR